jgi:hypothetical protein
MHCLRDRQFFILLMFVLSLHQPRSFKFSVTISSYSDSSLLIKRISLLVKGYALIFIFTAAKSWVRNILAMYSDKQPFCFLSYIIKITNLNENWSAHTTWKELVSMLIFFISGDVVATSVCCCGCGIQLWR